MKNETKIIHTPIDSDGNVDKYYLVITEIADSEIVRSYIVKLPNWVGSDLLNEFKYYQLVLN